VTTVHCMWPLLLPLQQLLQLPLQRNNLSTLL
jgi:hypothetical protein